MFKWIIKIFFRWFYRVKPPEMVKYGQESKGYARGKITKAEDGSVEMQIQGEKYPFPGHPRGHVLLGGSLEKIKGNMKKQIFHALFDAAADATPDMFPTEQLCPFVKDLWRVFELMEEAEITGDMKSQVKNMKKAFCFFLQEDDAWRFRVQWFFERLNYKKCRCDKKCMYYLRGKWFRPDKYTKKGNLKYEY